jgi:hypothetical protein
VPGGHTRKFTDSRSLRVTEYSGGKNVQRRHRGENKITEDFVELCQKGIEQVQECTRRTMSSSSRRGVSEERHSQSC